jgi:4-amino-4-deoxy-L-arabinose transferase-like glycosyltransferase
MSTETRPAQPISRQRLEFWLQSHADIVALVDIALGFLLRLRAGLGTYLNPDEATNYLIAHQASLSAVYHASLTDPHPPLSYFLLYFWRMLGDSEFMLRLPSMLAGTVFLWFAYRWAGEMLGKTAGLVSLLILAFSPVLISMSAEVRNYSLLLLLLAATLWTLQRALEKPSVRRIVVFSILLLLSILTHYSMFVVTLALGGYVAIRALRRELPAPVMKSWVLMQAVAAGLWVLLYMTHLAHLKGSGMERSAADIWLRASYFHRGEGNPLLFPVQATGMLFRYLFDSRLLGVPQALFAF